MTSIEDLFKDIEAQNNQVVTRLLQECKPSASSASLTLTASKNESSAEIDLDGLRWFIIVEDLVSCGNLNEIPLTEVYGKRHNIIFEYLFFHYIYCWFY